MDELSFHYSSCTFIVLIIVLTLFAFAKAELYLHVKESLTFFVCLQTIGSVWSERTFVT